MNKSKNISLKIANPALINNLCKLSTESLLIWIIGKMEEKRNKMTIEEITLECWLINPHKHSMRGYPQFPDSFVVMKRIFDMKGRKGLLMGTVQEGFHLTEILKRRYADINTIVNEGKVKNIKSNTAADRTISSFDEAPYKRLIKTPAYIKFKNNKIIEIVETDFLYFYGITWYSKPTVVENKLKNIDAIVNRFSKKDPRLVTVRNLLNEKYNYVKNKLLKLE